jgi:very-short-patch-repair endonuclease
MRGLRFVETERSRKLRKDATSAETLVWRRIRNRAVSGAKFVRQAPIGPFFADFLCRERKLIIEIDGATHSTDEELASDAFRTRRLEELGYQIIRFNNADVFENIDSVIDTIFAALTGSPTGGP